MSNNILKGDPKQAQGSIKEAIGKISGDKQNGLESAAQNQVGNTPGLPGRSAPEEREGNKKSIEPMNGIMTERSELEQRLRSAVGKIMATRHMYPSQQAMLLAIAAELDEVEETASNRNDWQHVSQRIDRLLAAAGQI